MDIYKQVCNYFAPKGIDLIVQGYLFKNVLQTESYNVYQRPKGMSMLDAIDILNREYVYNTLFVGKKSDEPLPEGMYFVISS